MPDDGTLAGQRLECLLIGATLGDGVGDLGWVLQELGEDADPTSETHNAALTELEAIAHKLDEMVGEANRKCGLPESIRELWIQFEGERAKGDLTGMRNVQAGLSDTLGQGGGE